MPANNLICFTNLFLLTFKELQIEFFFRVKELHQSVFYLSWSHRKNKQKMMLDSEFKIGFMITRVFELVQASHTPAQCGGSSQLFGELFDSSGKGTWASPGAHSYPWNKQTSLRKNLFRIISLCTHLVSASMLGEMLCQKWAKTLKDYA